MKFFVLPPPHFYPSSPVLGNGFIARLLHKEFPLKKFNQTRFLGHFRILFSTRMSAIVVVQVLTLFVRHQYQCHTTILRNLTFHPFPVHHGIALCSTIPTRDWRSLRCRGRPCKQKGPCSAMVSFSARFLPYASKRSTECEGLKIPIAAAGGPANKTPVLRNVALFSPAFAFRPQAVAAFADEKRRCFSASPFCLRRVRDSNPRTREGQRFSRPPRSTTLPTLRGKNTTFFRSPHTPPKNFYSRLLFNILSYLCKENNIFLFIL